MRRLFVLAAALAIMLALRALRVDAGVDGADPLTLAAIGFVVLASFTVGEMMGGFKLPKITGYILSGVLLGPHVSDILSVRVVNEMSAFNTLALGLIATTAGLELELKAIRRVWSTLASMIALKIPLLLVFVGGSAWGIEYVFAPLGVGPGSSAVAIALILAVLGIGTSPAVVLAVVNESRSKGRLTDITLSMAIVKDLVVVLALALAVAVARTLVRPGAAMSSQVLVQVSVELATSIGVGAVLGLLLIAYIRFVHREMLLAVLVAVLVTAEAAAQFHLELLLVFIAAGFVVRNVSDYEHELLHALEKVSLPVFVVFFTTAGADVDLGATVSILPLALVLVGGRAVAYAIAGRVGGHLGGETQEISRNAWLAFTPQAGVTLGLVFLAAKALPEIAEPLTKTGLALVALNLLVGPVLLGLALRRVGEIPEGVTSEPPQPRLPSSPAEKLVEPGPVVASEEPEPRAPEEISLPRPLADAHASVREDVHGLLESFVTDVLVPVAERGRKVAARLVLADDGAGTSAAVVAAALRSVPPDVAEGLEDAARALGIALTETLRRRPETISVPVEIDELHPNADDGRVLAIRLASARLRHRLAASSRVRAVPLQRAARYTYEPAVAEMIETVVGRWFRAQAALLIEVRHAVEGGCSAEDCRGRLEQISEHYIETARQDLLQACLRSSRALTQELSVLATPRRPVDGLRLSEVDARTKAAYGAVARNAEPWRGAIDAAYDTLRANAEARVLSDGVEEVVQRRIFGALEVVESELSMTIRDVRDRAVALEAAVAASESLGAELVEQARALFAKRDQDRYGGLTIRYRQRAQATDLLSELTGLVDALPDRLRILALRDLDCDVVDPGDLATTELRLSHVAESTILDRLVPSLTDAMTPLSGRVASAEEVLEDSATAASYALEALAPTEGDEEQRAAMATAARAAVERSSARIGTILDEIDADVGAIRTDVESALRTSREALETAVQRPSGAVGRVRASAEGTRRALLEGVRRVRANLARRERRLFGRAVSVLRGRSIQDWRIRTGQTLLDPSGMARYVDRFAPPPGNLRLPPLYEQVFTIEPIEDLSMAVAYHAELGRLVKSIQPGHREDFANIVIVGEHGSGRTSLVNLLERRLARHRVVRVDPRFHRRVHSLIRVVAMELGCRADFASIETALRNRTSVILIDDLEHYIRPIPTASARLERFVNLVVRTSAFAHWVITVERTALREFDELAALSNAFGRRVTLAPLPPAALREVIETRIRLAGSEVAIQPRRAFGRALSFGSGRNEDGYYRAVAHASGGNLRAAILAHLRSLAVEGEALVARAPVAVELPFLEQLPAEALAVLSVLLRFGPLEPRHIAEALGKDEAFARASMLPLEDAALIAWGSDRRASIPRTIEHAVAGGLTRARVVKTP